MKIALIFHGLSEGKNQKDFNTSFNEQIFENIKTNLIRSNECDIFFHSWSNKFESKIINILKPSNYIFENQELFRLSIQDKLNNLSNHFNNNFENNLSNLCSNKEYLFSFFSRFYSLYKSVLLIQNTQNYDVVIITRFDIYFKKIYDITQYNKQNTLYINQFYGSEYCDGCKNINIDGIMSNFNKNIFLYGVQDFIFFGNKSIITKFSKLYINLNQYLQNQNFLKNKWPRTISGHSICKFHIDNTNINFEFTKYNDRQTFIIIRPEIELFNNIDKLEEQGKFLEGIILLNKHLDKHTSYHVLNKIGFLYYKLNNYVKSIENYKNSIKKCKNIQAYRNLIAIYLETKDKINAQKYMEEYLKSFKNNKIQKIYENLF